MEVVLVHDDVWVVHPIHPGGHVFFIVGVLAGNGVDQNGATDILAAKEADGTCKLQRVLVGGETRPVALQALRSAGIERSGLRDGGFNGVGLNLQGVKRRQQLGGINGVALLADNG